MTRLNGTPFGVNPDLIQRVETAPDTILTLVDGSKYVITETLQDVIRLVTEHKATVLAHARDMPSTVSEPEDTAPHLVVHEGGNGDDPPPPVPLRPRSP
ncbi:flagellar FlbD family protein [Xylanimonas oleitrophica]|uniref:flagellar FlbD family protein n=1 Tax=Xylanimonas oleitrophica TaxID=2607479 RepID=UPI001FEC6377|nr:flagellar FlbD family protein [Xylanimonas oleitrophica]